MTADADCDVLLVNPPWSELGSPSLQLSILKSIARQEGFKCDVLYANLLLAKYVEPQLYNKFLETLWFLGEWLFSQAAFGNRGQPEVSDSEFLDYYIARDVSRRVCDHPEPPLDPNDRGEENCHKHILAESLGTDFRNVIETLKQKTVPTYLSHMREIFDRYKKTRIVGFTTTFNQNIPSMALAKILKERFHDKTVVFGGANCDGVMGPAIMRVSPNVDYVVSGDAEETFPSLLKILLSRNNESITRLRGISYRSNAEVRTNPPAPPITNLDAFPIMDCDDYYQQRGELQKECGVTIERGPVFYECSRGCWWGQHSHCTFCGLNGLSMTFRSKSPDIIVNQLVALSKRHNVLSFRAADNILNPAYFVTLLPKLKATVFDFDLFFEVKANMTKPQVKILAESGVRLVQPGIESFSTRVLRLMRKGTTMLQNIQTLKWFEEYGIHPEWNLIGGFPGENEEDYLSIERVIPLLYHLPPPRRPEFTRIEMHRFSPNFDFAEEFGFKKVRPKQYYDYIYDLNDDLLCDIAYYFDYELPGFERFLPHVNRINHLLEGWHRKYYSEEAELSYGRGPDFIEVIDERDGFTKELSLRGYEMEILLCCDNVSTLDMIMKSLRNRGQTPNETDILASIKRLEANGLVLTEEGKHLSLPVARNPMLDKPPYHRSLPARLTISH